MAIVLSILNLKGSKQIQKLKKGAAFILQPYSSLEGDERRSGRKIVTTEKAREGKEQQINEKKKEKKLCQIRRDKKKL